MLPFLKNHPFAVEAFFKSSLVLTFAIPKEEVVHLIPEPLRLDTFKDKWAFIAVAMVQTNNLRPKGFPRFFGNDFFLIGYRVFVRFNNKAGRNLRGLYILKSETDKTRMTLFGNMFTHYNYTTTDIKSTIEKDTLEFSSINSGFKLKVERGDAKEISLPGESPFSEWSEARRFAGPLPFTFTYNSSDKKVLIIEGVRDNWKPAPVKVLECHFSFLDNLKLQGIRLANAFIVDNIPYYWKKGKSEPWKKEENSRAY